MSRWSSAPTPAGHQPEPHQGQQGCWMASRWPGPRPTGAGGLPTLRDDVWGAGTGGGRGPPSVTQSGLSVSVHSLQSEARVGPRVFPSFCQAPQLSDPPPHIHSHVRGSERRRVSGPTCTRHSIFAAQMWVRPESLWTSNPVGGSSAPPAGGMCGGPTPLFTAASQSRCERQASLGPAPGSCQELRAGPDVETMRRRPSEQLPRPQPLA